MIEAVPWTTPRKGRRAGCCSITPLGGGLWSSLVFGAPFFLVDPPTADKKSKGKQQIEVAIKALTLKQPQR